MLAVSLVTAVRSPVTSYRNEKMDVQELKVWDREDGIVEMIDLDEEHFSISSFSAADAAFDAVICSIEDIIMDDEFQKLQRDFMEKYYLEFDASEENKLSYTPIFNEYVDLLEKHLEQQLTEKIPDFHMNTFIELLQQREEEVPGDIFDTLLTFTDFMAFKEMLLDYKEKKGRGADLSEGLLVTSGIGAGSKHSSTDPQ